MKLPSFFQWIQFPKVLSKGEKILIFILFIFAAGSGIFLARGFYFNFTKASPVSGGIYVEGMVGQPRFINPIYAETNDIDRDLTNLIFSGLMTYNEKGELVKDLAKEYKILDDGKIYEFYLKDNTVWHDGSSLTTDDIIFTIETIKSSDYKSPLRARWLGIKTEKISDRSVRFKLEEPYSPFLENCTLKIIPKHVWKDISPENFPLSSYNLKPIGSGIFKFSDLEQAKQGFIKSISLKSNSKYYQKQPFLSEIKFQFFQDKQDLTNSFNKEEIDGLSLNAFENYNLEQRKEVQWYSYKSPRYFAAFFNLEDSKILSQKEIRKALNYATNKQEVIESFTQPNQKVEMINSPILPDFFGYSPPKTYYEFSPEKAKNILDKLGFSKKENGIREKTVTKEPAFQFKSHLEVGSRGKEVTELQKCLAKDKEVYPDGRVTGYFGNLTKNAVIRFQEKYREEVLTPSGFSQGVGYVGKNTRKKLNELCAPTSQQVNSLSFSLKTVNQPQLIEVAEILKKQWKQVGININIQALDISDLTPIIKRRNYDILLFGESLGVIPDPFPFWHSSQVKDPGLNLSRYDSSDADKLLKESRETLDTSKRKENYEKLQNILIADAPAVFLYSPGHSFLVSEKIKGVNGHKLITPSQRLSNIENWYVKTGRVWR